ncbi:MAG: diguanylate cyclase [Desulfovibrionaceae bacterium]|nr:diguanylate cyclase [Desulfovibrionaceae bacterium]
MGIFSSYKKSFKARIILPAVIVLVVLVVILNFYSSVKFLHNTESLIYAQTIANINSLMSYIDASKDSSRTAAISMALNIDAVNAIKKRDINEILRIFAPMHKFYRVNYYTICDSEGIVLARTYAPDHFGDSILNQQNVLDAMDGKIATYFEAGTLIKVAVRTGAPVFDADGELIGVVSAGVRFDLDSSVDELKRLLNAEATVFLGDTRITTTIMADGVRATGTALDPAIAKIVIEDGREYFGDADILGSPYKTFYKPLLDATGEAFAALCIGIPLAELKEMSDILIRDGIIIGFTGLIISIMILFVILSSISKPIIMLSDNMDNVADGNLNINIMIKTEDEVGQLGKSSQKVVDIIRKLIKDINTTIIEHEKGNTDYCLDIGEFQGDYQVLAGRIVELADLGALDQLTRIPNRRSFDNRLALEWDRAIRGKTSLSILLMDVDRFKNYNDTYGHQQGDVALRTVAKVLPQSLKRTIDFAARWGGEEFVVLLPDTDSSGALTVAEHIRAGVENTVIPSADERAAKVTISIGVNTQIPTQSSSIDDFISKADEALYTAKATGRNRAVSGAVLGERRNGVQGVESA